MKEGLSFQAHSFIQKLKIIQQQNLPTSNELVISSDFLDRYPILRQFIHFLQTSATDSNGFSNRFRHTVIETIISNYVRSKNHYCYNDSIRDFGSCIFILSGRHVYEYIRPNISGFLPSLPIIQASIDSTMNRILEGEFRYDLLSEFLSCEETNFIFLSEGCTGVVPHLVLPVMEKCCYQCSTGIIQNDRRIYEMHYINSLKIHFYSGPFCGQMISLLSIAVDYLPLLFLFWSFPH